MTGVACVFGRYGVKAIPSKAPGSRVLDRCEPAPAGGPAADDSLRLFASWPRSAGHGSLPGGVTGSQRERKRERGAVRTGTWLEMAVRRHPAPHGCRGRRAPGFRIRDSPGIGDYNGVKPEGSPNRPEGPGLMRTGYPRRVCSLSLWASVEVGLGRLRHGGPSFLRSVRTPS